MNVGCFFCKLLKIKRFKQHQQQCLISLIIINLSFEIITIVFVVGIVAGFINVLAANGSMLILPLLILLGMEPDMANGTNRIAILFQNIMAVRNFQKQKILSVRANAPFIISAIIGAFCGSLVVISVDKNLLNYIIGYIFIGMFVLMLAKKNYWFTNSKQIDANRIKSKWQWTAFFLIGFFGGFIQAGVGFFILAWLVARMGYDIIKANAVKVLIILAYTPVSIAIFYYYGLINWKLGLILSGGHVIGAYFASKYASRIGIRFINYLLLVIILLSGLELIGTRELIFSFFGLNTQNG